jgi:hypothetical protein
MGKAVLSRKTCNMREGLTRHQTFGEFLPHTLGHQRLDLTGLHHLHHQCLGFGGHLKVGKTCGKAGQPQNAHRVFAKRNAHMAQDAQLQITLSAKRVGTLALGVLGDGVDGQVASCQVLL